jgi:hypothetical protein
MSDPEKVERKSNPKSNSTEDKDSKKLWITLPVEYSEILDILSGDAPERVRSNRKSVIIEKMIDDYLEKHEKTLEDDGKWKLIINARKKTVDRISSGEKSIEEITQSLENAIKLFPEFQDQFSLAKALGDNDGLQDLYKIILDRYSEIKQKNTA